METTIIKTVKGSTMEKIFDKSKIINVKNYEALNVSDTMYKPSKKYQFHKKDFDPMHNLTQRALIKYLNEPKDKN